jgi:hypothetical protein
VRPEKNKELTAKGRLITDITLLTREGKFQIRVAGRIIDVSPEEIKALLSAGPAQAYTAPE